MAQDSPGNDAVGYLMVIIFFGPILVVVGLAVLIAWLLTILAKAFLYRGIPALVLWSRERRARRLSRYRRAALGSNPVQLRWDDDLDAFYYSRVLGPREYIALQGNSWVFADGSAVVASSPVWSRL